MEDIETRANKVLAELERLLEKDRIDIAKYASERDQRVGMPNCIDNFFKPAVSLLFGKAAPQSEKPAKMPVTKSKPPKDGK